ncbi:hypothetical protein R1T16_16050 [Flavobacterium sp. DG1-102-2]|uniref:hypothetical protein n=1 Tax=Flavobacterium sp. DG1-102-2 TaxID=3081663 RepID=UPI00294A1DF8|nr:hypothetical protein [Flavobacterium sp. DG1-102-2]MDV6169951.1 hypothetical protein [Flavobacterium sp. DG1-102-2]
MFKKTQHYLLLNHPLLWNVKFVPLVITGLLINIIFFISGYIYGEIDFSEIREEYYYGEGSPALVTFLSIILSLLILIMWIVYYIRNNAFKSFYPKKRTSLFKEWILIFIVCLFNCSYFITFTYATEVRARHYYSKAELIKRQDILSKASLFTEGSYERGTDTVFNKRRYTRKIFSYCGKTYEFSSLLNKLPYTFSMQGHSKDSVTLRKVRRWLVNGNKDSIYNVLKQFHDLAEKEHDLKGNITANEWFDLIYHYPDFNHYKVIGNNSFSPVFAYETENNTLSNTDEYDEYQYDQYTPLDSAKIDYSINIKKVVNGKSVILPKYYVPMSALKTVYGRINKAYTNPVANFTMLAALIYFTLGLSMLLFSFRATSGRSWLISGVSGGILVFATALLSVVIDEVVDYRFRRINGEYMFLAIWVVIVILLLLYYIITSQRKSKGISGIVLNMLLWLLPFLIPAAYTILNHATRNLYTYKIIDGKTVSFDNPVYVWTNANFGTMFFLNIVFVGLYMYFFTVSIKKWKGIAEA